MLMTECCEGCCLGMAEENGNTFLDLEGRNLEGVGGNVGCAVGIGDFSLASDVSDG